MGAAEDIHIPFDEAEAARRLGMSKATLMRERVAGRINPMRFGQRLIRYTEEILEEYRQLCRSGLDKSVTSGSAKGKALMPGAGHGSMPTLGKQDAHHLAQSIFKKRK